MCLWKIEVNWKVGYSVRTAYNKNVSSEGDTTNGSDKLYKFIEYINDTISSYHINNTPEIYNGALLEKDKSSIENKWKCTKTLEVLLSQNVFDHQF